MRKQLIDLREKMKEYGVAAYIVPTTDFHGSEYVHEYFKCREYVSGFTGSAGTLAVTGNAAALWTDGRYFLQAAEQLEGSGIELMREGEPDTPELTEWLKMQRGEELTEWSVAFDGRIADWRFGKKLKECFDVCGNLDLVGEIWENRPKLCGSEIYALPLSVTGESAYSKLSRLRAEMRAVAADCHLITSLEETAWLFNLRGSDILHTPVFYAFTLIMPECVKLYLLNDDEKVKSLFDDVNGELSKAAADAVKLREGTAEEKIELHSYFEIFDDLKKLGGAGVLFDEKTSSYTLAKAICENEGVKPILREDPAMLMKAVKNETEIACTKQAHIRDGAAVTEFIYRLKKIAAESVGEEGKLPLTEISASEMLWEERKKQGAYDTSFDTIAAYGEHAAIIHYEPTEESDAVLKNEGFLLIDSGGQYADGTTDITRTIALGGLTEEMKRCYTAVLKGHIALATARFDSDTSGADLDRLARRPLLDEGIDYKHGTGHGVGHLLGVHEGPNTISPRGKECRFAAGMITSNEPGVYIEGKFGIRLENEILCIEAEAANDCNTDKPDKAEKSEKTDKAEKSSKVLEFETISFCPFEREAILPEMLTSAEKEWLNTYHAEVREKISPLLTAAARNWLTRQTAAI